MRAAGYIKLARKQFDGEDPYWGDGTPFDSRSAWTDLIQMAAFKPFKYRGVDQLERGEFVASVRFLAERWQWSKSAVQRWLKTAEKLGRIAGQRVGQHGHVYRLVNYDTYQMSENDSGTPNGTATESNLGQKRDRSGTNKKAVKAVKALETTGSVAPFPKETCDTLYDAWIAKRGAVGYGTFRKALAPLFPAGGALYSTPQLVAAVEAFAELAEIDKPEFSQKWTVFKFAAEMQRWVKLGALPYVDSWGTPTERAIACKLFAPDLPPSGRYVA